MNSKIKFLLFSDSNIKIWEETMGKAVLKLGLTYEISDQTDFKKKPPGKYEFIFIDARSFPDLKESISQIHDQEPMARIIVLSSAPSWIETREVMLAGASYYSDKPSNCIQAFKLIEKIFQKYKCTGGNDETLNSSG